MVLSEEPTLYSHHHPSFLSLIWFTGKYEWLLFEHMWQPGFSNQIFFLLIGLWNLTFCNTKAAILQCVRTLHNRISGVKGQSWWKQYIFLNGHSESVMHKKIKYGNEFSYILHFKWDWSTKKKALFTLVVGVLCYFLTKSYVTIRMLIIPQLGIQLEGYNFILCIWVISLWRESHNWKRKK